MILAEKPFYNYLYNGLIVIDILLDEDRGTWVGTLVWKDYHVAEYLSEQWINSNERRQKSHNSQSAHYLG